jgi:hypothetical protein
MTKISIKFFNIDVLGIFVVGLIFIYLNSSRIISLWDLSNYSDIAVRIMSGQKPYIDFPLYIQPLSFYELAVSFKVFGQNVYAMYAVILIKLLIYSYIWKNMIDQILESNSLSSQKIKKIFYLLAALVNPWLIVPQPSYDADLSIAILISLALMLHFDSFSKQLHKVSFLIIIILLFYPFFYKQTSGIVWLVLVSVYFYFTVNESKYKNFIILILFIFLFYSILNYMQDGFVYNWFSNTVTRPIETRLIQGRDPLSLLLNSMKYGYHISLFLLFFLINKVMGKSFSKIEFFRFCLVYSPIAVIFSSFFRQIFEEDKSLLWESYLESLILLNWILVFFSIYISKFKSKISFIQLIILITCAANYLSQGISGSSYAFWHLYLLVYLLNFRFLKELQIKAFGSDSESKKMLIAAVIFVFPSIVYSLTLERMNFVRFDEPVQKFRSLYGWIGTPGGYLEESQTGIDLFEKYSKLGRTTVWPGEDPVALFSGTVPDTDVSVSDATTNPSYKNIDNWLKESDIQFVILKTRLQLPGLHQASIDAFEIAKQNFQEVEKKGVYVVLKSRS